MRHKKHLGQHFLLDRQVISKMLDALSPSGKKVLEVGAGTGVVSEAVAKCQPKKLVSVEIDAEAAAKARERLKQFKFAELRLADIRDVDFKDFDVILGSIPYYLSSYLVFKSLKARKPALFVVQKEFADRLVGIPGSKQWSRLSLMAQNQAEVNVCFEVSRYSFYPPPEVDSSVVVLIPKNPLLIDERVVTALFSHKNQNVKKALVHAARALGLDKKQAKDLPLEFSGKKVRDLLPQEWVELSHQLNSFRSKH